MAEKAVRNKRRAEEAAALAGPATSPGVVEASRESQDPSLSPARATGGEPGPSSTEKKKKRRETEKPKNPVSGLLREAVAGLQGPDYFKYLSDVCPSTQGPASRTKWGTITAPEPAARTPTASACTSSSSCRSFVTKSFLGLCPLLSALGFKPGPGVAGYHYNLGWRPRVSLSRSTWTRPGKCLLSPGLLPPSLHPCHSLQPRPLARAQGPPATPPAHA